MASKVQPVPAGYHTATPYLIVKGAAKALDYYKKAFGAEEIMRFAMPGGQIGHAEIKIGDSPIMLADESPEMGAVSPATIGGSAVAIMLYVEYGLLPKTRFGKKFFLHAAVEGKKP